MRGVYSIFALDFLARGCDLCTIISTKLRHDPRNLYTKTLETGADINMDIHIESPGICFRMNSFNVVQQFNEIM